MIEDDLRTLLAGELDVAVYSRLFPIGMPESVMVQEIGGRSSTAGIRRNYRTISVMACSASRDAAGERMREARDILVRSIPADINGTHYYTAVPQADGSLWMKAERKYVAYVDIEVGCSI